MFSLFVLSIRVVQRVFKAVYGVVLVNKGSFGFEYFLYFVECSVRLMAHAMHITGVSRVIVILASPWKIKAFDMFTTFSLFLVFRYFFSQGFLIIHIIII